jgi:hypothetical protein
VSIEFNLLYRWHATISEADTAWTEKRFSEIMKGADPRTVIYFSVAIHIVGLNFSKQVSPTDFFRNLRGMVDPGTDITEWTFDGSVASFRYIEMVTLMLGTTALSVKTAASEMRTWPEFYRTRRRHPQALSRHAERPKSCALLSF